MTVILDPDTLALGLAELGQADPRVAAALAALGPPQPRRWTPGFDTLVDVICGQQVSNAAAAAIQAKLRAAVDPLTPAGILAASDETLRAAGVSRQKLAYVRDLAAAVTDGRVDLDRLPAMADEAAIAALVTVKGIGRWTAEIYLLFALGRPDVWPAEDLGLQLGLQHLRGLAERPSGRAMRGAADPWRPWRGAAAHLLWHVYHRRTSWSPVP